MALIGSGMATRTQSLKLRFVHLFDGWREIAISLIDPAAPGPIINERYG